MMLPSQACFAPGEAITVEVDPDPRERVIEVERLGERVASVVVEAAADVITLPPLPEGGYALRLRVPGGPAGQSAVPGQSAVLGQSAVEVLADPVSRLRYGFVASFAPGREVEPVLRNFRRLHLSGAQFYDWAYRHAELVGPAEYADPLGQPVSLATVRALADGLRAGGTRPIGYAAVYGVGKQEWPRWEQAALLRADGVPHDLGGFLSLVDPSDPDWLAHFTADLRRAVAAGGFAGFHLDQYGYPRLARRPDGRVVDLEVAFDALIRAVRAALPEATLVFNNVNDFPAWVTTASPQDVTYTEVWQPHDGLADLAAVATRARTLAPTRPAVVAAYQTIFKAHPAAVSELTTKLTMATLFSHGATQLLAGEAGHVLVDPYYVRNHAGEPSTVEMLARWYDLLVAAGDLLLAPGAADITRSVVGSLNDEIDVLAPAEVAVSHEARPDVVWRRVVRTPQGTVVHLINLVGQPETGWDTPKAPVTPVSGLRLRLRRVGAGTPVVRVADPDRGAFFTDIPVRPEGEHWVADLQELAVWQLVFLGSVR